MTDILQNAATSDAAIARSKSGRDWLYTIAIVLAVIGVAISGYLTYTKLFSVEQICAKDATFNCELVQNTVYSRILGVPIQFIGLGGYIFILGVLLLERRVSLLANMGLFLVFGMTLFGFLYSAYLTAIEAFVIHAWCMWCLGSAITMTALFVTSGLRVWRQMSKPIDLDALIDAEV